MSNVFSITINEHGTPCIEYGGCRIVTFDTIDGFHGRKSGETRKLFYDNMGCFVEGEDYFKIRASEIRTRKIIGTSKHLEDTLILITESGYTTLVMLFRDTAVLKVHKSIVNTYFNGSNIDRSHIIDALIDKYETLLTESQNEKDSLERKLAAAKSCKHQISTNCSTAANATPILSSIKNKSKIAVGQISRFYDMSAYEFNLFLTDAGVQFRGIDNVWQLTNKYSDKGYVHYIKYQNPDQPKTMYWTPLGVCFLVGFLAEHNLYPIDLSQMNCQTEYSVDTF